MSSLLKIVAIACAVSIMSGCSSTISKMNKDKYMDKKSESLDIATVSSSNNPCVDGFNFLKASHNTEYQQYINDYRKVYDGFAFLKKNSSIMDKDARDVYTMTLNMKLDTLCKKVQYSGFQETKEQLATLDNI